MKKMLIIFRVSDLQDLLIFAKTFYPTLTKYGLKADLLKRCLEIPEMNQVNEKIKKIFK